LPSGRDPWAPQFCSSHGSSASPTECDPQKHFGFVVHGLWPENTNGSYPQSCSTAKQVSQDIIDQMMPIMPDAGLMQHEWSKHGTCSGLSMQDYFNDIQKTFQQLQIPQEYRAPQQTVSARPSDIQQKFADTNNAPRNAFVVGCTGSQFEQLQVCLTKDLQYRQCGSGLQKCTRSQIQIRPTP